MRQRSLSSPARSPSSGGMHVLQDPAVVSSAVAEADSGDVATRLEDAGPVGGWAQALYNTGLWLVDLVQLVGMALGLALFCVAVIIVAFVAGVGSACLWTGDCYLAAATCYGSFVLGDTPPGYDRTLRMACGDEEILVRGPW